MTLFKLKNNQHNGFTIIELIVVMAIIGVLAAALVVGFSRQQASSRDAKRKADLSTINTALQSYLSDKNTVIASSAANDSGTEGWDVSSVPTTGPKASNFITWLKTTGYALKIPVDPINDGNATFYDKSGGTGTGYAYGYNSPIDGPTGYENDIVYTLATVLELENNNYGIYSIIQSIRPK